MVEAFITPAPDHAVDPDATSGLGGTDTDLDAATAVIGKYLHLDDETPVIRHFTGEFQEQWWEANPRADRTFQADIDRCERAVGKALTERSMGEGYKLDTVRFGKFYLDVDGEFNTVAHDRGGEPFVRSMAWMADTGYSLAFGRIQASDAKLRAVLPPGHGYIAVVRDQALMEQRLRTKGKYEGQTLPSDWTHECVLGVAASWGTQMAAEEAMRELDEALRTLHAPILDAYESDPVRSVGSENDRYEDNDSF